MKKTNLIIISIFFLCSCSKKLYTAQDFYSTKKIDAHIHIRNKNDTIAHLAKADNFHLININVNHTDSTLRLQKAFTKYQVEANPKQVLWLDAFSMGNWDSPNWAAETIEMLKESFAKGALGIKIWKNIGMVVKDKDGQQIMIDNPRFDPVIQYVISQNKTILGHLGEPRNCWLPLEQMTVNNDRNYFQSYPKFHMYLHPEMPGYEAQIDARDRFLARHTDLRFVGAHLGSLEYDVDSLAKRLDKFPNMAVDFAERLGHLQVQSQKDYQKIRNFVIKYQDRIIYGTDLVLWNTSDPILSKTRFHNRWLEEWKYLTSDEKMTIEQVNGEFSGLKLPKKVIDKIYYKNAIRWYKIEKYKTGTY